MARRRVSVQVRLIGLLLVVVLATGAVVTWQVDASMSSNLFSATDRSLSLTLQTLVVSLRNLMLAGEAPVLVKAMADLKGLAELEDVAVFRSNGRQAFADGETVADVNARVGAARFELTPRLPEIPPEAVDPGDVRRAVAEVATVSRLREGEMDYLSYWPVENLLECQRCHGDADPVRGVAFVRASVEPTYRQIGATRLSLAALFGAAVLAITALLAVFLRRAIVVPVLRIGEVARIVGSGDLSARVTLSRRDEVGELATEINRMIEGLEERFHLSKYVSSSTIDSIRAGSRGIERKRLVVLFTDIRGFTAYSESRDAETVVTNLNLVLEAQAEIVARRGGDVDKFVGDAVMALFRDEASAVACALELVAAVARLDEEKGTGLRIGAGVASGEVIAGDIGSRNRKEYAAIGDTVNVASRLCSVARRDMVVASESVARGLGPRLDAVAVPGQKLKGKKEPVTVYVVRGLSEA